MNLVGQKGAKLCKANGTKKKKFQLNFTFISKINEWHSTDPFMVHRLYTFRSHGRCIQNDGINDEIFLAKREFNRSERIAGILYASVPVHIRTVDLAFKFGASKWSTNKFDGVSELKKIEKCTDLQNGLSSFMQ